MENQSTILTQLLDLIYIDLIGVTVLTVYIFLFYFNWLDSNTFRIRVNLFIGSFYCVVFWLLGYYEITDYYNPVNLLLSLLCTVAAYQWILRRVLKILRLDYNRIDK